MIHPLHPTVHTITLLIKFFLSLINMWHIKMLLDLLLTCIPLDFKCVNKHGLMSSIFSTPKKKESIGKKSKIGLSFFLL